jgi:uncharacterized membrane protein YfcA
VDDGRRTHGSTLSDFGAGVVWTEGLVLVASILAGGIAAVTGFGIGSVLTPVLALQVDTRLAVAAVSVPHVVGTAIRFWLLSGGVDRRVFWSFGLTSAAGGLIGALLHSWASNRWLNALFGILLVFAAASEWTGLARRMRFRGPVAWIAGAVSGLLGGLVGNQGGLRSAALLGFGLSKHSLVATATAIGLVVDGARMPVNLMTQARDVAGMRVWIVVATLGVAAGTVLGSRVLARIPETWFHRVLAIVLALLGTAMLWRAFRA